MSHKKSRSRGGCLTAIGVFTLIFAVLLAFWLVPGPGQDYDGLQIACNRTPRRRSAWNIDYIVIHDTANPSPGADARRHYDFFNSGNRDSSADFFVDSNGALQINNYYRYYTWHCGDGGPGAKINNRNSVGVEICINQDGDYATAKANAADLTRELMKTLHIDKDHVVRHQDASGKNCPGTMSREDWQDFLDSL